MDSKRLKVIGGLLAFTGGFLVFIPCMWSLDRMMESALSTVKAQWFLNLYLVAIIALIGGFLGIVSKRSGGVLALLAGLTALLLPLFAVLINNADVAVIFTQYSSFWGYTVNIQGFAGLVVYYFTVGSETIFISIESLLILAGGIIILIPSSTENK